MFEKPEIPPPASGLHPRHRLRSEGGRLLYFGATIRLFQPEHPANIAASFEKGVLTVMLPKTAAA